MFKVTYKLNRQLKRISSIRFKNNALEAITSKVMFLGGVVAPYILDPTEKRSNAQIEAF